MHEPEGTDGHEAEQADDRSRKNDGDTPSISKGKQRSKAWEPFDIIEFVDGKPAKVRCKYCHKELRCSSKNGTSTLLKHPETCKKKRGAGDQLPNPSSTENGTIVAIGDSGSRKRMRIHESTHNAAANTHTWNRAKFSNRIQQMTYRLQEAVSEVLKLHGSDSVANSNLYQSTTSDSRPRTSSLVQREMYGRVAEKKSIIKLMTEDKSDGVIVQPIVGIGGVGKTALAQHVYNDPIVESQFQHRIWVWVSNNLDKVRLTREMLDFVCQEKYEGLYSFAKLQEILMSHIKSKKVLLILDDVWDDMSDYQWNQLLAPLKSDNGKGNVILVTTRKLSVAKRMGTVEPIKLGALKNEDFRLLFEACAFGDENYEGYPSLKIIGQRIAEKLKGNPLAAETAGELLRGHLTIDHWSDILNNEKWKSLQHSGGIMLALKRSFDQLPYHLQQCFSYCSIFPNNQQFLGEELVHLWISQGFVKCSHSSKRLEEIGWDYLVDLVNSSFFQQVESIDSSTANQTYYVMDSIMHDFSRMVSRTECKTIDDSECNEVLSNIHHLSIVTNSAYCKDQHGTIEKLQNIVASIRKLRTLVLIGQYDSSFFQSFQGIFQKAQKLRLLRISATSADFNSFLCNWVNSVHLRYLKLENKDDGEALPIHLNKFYHLQVLDVGSATTPCGMNDFVSLRHLIAKKGVYSSIASIGKMTSLQELHNFSVHNSSGFEITELQSMNELVKLGVSWLQNVRTRAEAYGARLKDKQYLENLRLYWMDTLSEDKYGSDMRWNPPIETEEERSEHLTDIARGVLEGLEPHHNLKHLRISGYNGAAYPTWLAASLTSLQTLHLECCGKLQILPSLKRLIFLRKFEVRNMLSVTDASVPSLEELVLDGMPKLERCSCTSVRNLNSSLRVLKIKWCPVLKDFPLFESSQKFKIEQKSWLPNLGELIIDDCPQLLVPHPLPPSTSVSKLHINRVSTLPSMEGSSSGTLRIQFSDELWTLDEQMFSFHNLRFLTELVLDGCRNLTSISFEGFRQLISLKRFEICHCEKLFSKHVLPEDTQKDMAAADCNALPSLECLSIVSCGIIGKWLSLMLRHVQALEKLDLFACEQITRLSIEEEENSQSNIISAPVASSSGCPDEALTSSVPEGLLRIPLSLISSLKKITIFKCRDLTFYRSKERFAGFTSLEELSIWKCQINSDQANGRWLLPQSLVQLHTDSFSSETLHPCFTGNLTCLKNLVVENSPSLKYLQLHDCTALEELTIEDCGSLTALEGLQSLGGLRYFRVLHNPSLKYLQLHDCTALEGLQSLGGLRYFQVLGCPRLQSLGSLGDHEQDGRWQLPQSLGELEIDEYCLDTLQPCFPGDLTCLKKLEVRDSPSLKYLQLHDCTALEKLRIESCGSLTALEGLQSLGGLRYFHVLECPGLPPCLESLPQLCPRLERLEIDDPAALTASFCKHLTSLQRLELFHWGRRLTDEQERALQLLTSLQELRFCYCQNDLVDLPAWLHSLPSLHRLEIDTCRGISRLPEKGLPPSLKELDITNGSKELTEQCRKLATSNLKVQISTCIQ